jgi:hypothetical protein
MGYTLEYPVGRHTGLLEEGFDIYSAYGHNENDQSDRYIISVKEILKKQEGQTDADFLKAQLVNIVKMFNANFEAYIVKVYGTKDFLDPNISVDLINSVVSGLFDYIKSVVGSAENKDGTLDDAMRESILGYFLGGFTVLYDKLAELKKKPPVSQRDDGVFLFTEEQITDAAFLGEPSIMHFVIVCDAGSSLATQLQTNPIDLENIQMSFFISNGMNGANNANFLLTVNNKTATLATTNTTYADYKESARYIKNSASNSDVTLTDIANEIVANNVDVYKIAQSNTGGPFVVILILMTALVFSLGYYFYALGGGRVVASAGAAASGAITSAAGAAANMQIGAPNLGEGVSTAGAMDSIKNAGGGLYVMHGILAVIFFILFIKLHGGDGLQEIQDSIKKGASEIISQATDNAGDVSHAIL